MRDSCDSLTDICNVCSQIVIASLDLCQIGWLGCWFMVIDTHNKTCSNDKWSILRKIVHPVPLVFRCKASWMVAGCSMYRKPRGWSSTVPSPVPMALPLICLLPDWLSFQTHWIACMLCELKNYLWIWCNIDHIVNEGEPVHFHVEIEEVKEADLHKNRKRTAKHLDSVFIDSIESFMQIFLVVPW